MSDKQSAGKRTPTETLVACMERFGECEPEQLLILYTDANGGLCWSTSNPMRHTQLIGMVECARAIFKKQMLDDED